MISTRLATRLRAAGLVWAPVSGDAFQLAGPDFEGDVFTVSDMTIEPHHYPSGTILGFNGTTEWALDSVSLEDALWLPREDQLRDALAGSFVALERRAGEGPAGSAAYLVTVRDAEGSGSPRVHEADDPAEAYGLALLQLLGGGARPLLD